MKHYLVKNRTTEYVICLPDDIDQVTSYAVTEFNNYLFSVTGLMLDVVSESKVAIGQKFVSIGKTKQLEQANFAFNYDLLNYDGFFIRTLGENLYFDALSKRGTVFAVYDFIEKFFGVKFIADDCEFFERKETITFDEIDITSAPDFALRVYLNATSMGLSKNRNLNYEFCLKKRYNHSFVNYSEKFGGRSNSWGRSDDQHHNFHYFVPREIYYETHPEFYYHDERYDMGCENGWTIDLLSGITDDGCLDESMDVSVAKIVIEEMKKDVLANPDINFFNFEQEDGPYCYQYEKGSKKQAIVDKYGRSGILIRFCNVIARELKHWADKELCGRKINIVTFAYEYTCKAPIIVDGNDIKPIDDTVVADDNVIIRVAIGGNRYYSYFEDAQFEWVKESIREWKVVARTFMFWAYDCDFNKYLWYLPFRHRIKQDMFGFKQLNVSDLIVQGAYSFKDLWLDKIKEYIYAKLLWNSKDNIDELYNEYMDIYYSHGAPYVKEMMALMDEHLRQEFAKDKNLAVRICEDVGYKLPEHYTAELIERCFNIIDTGIKKVREAFSGEEQDKYVRRLMMVRLTPTFMKLDLFKEVYGNTCVKEHLRLKNEFVALCSELDVVNIAEGYPISEFDKIFGEEIVAAYKK